MAGLLVLAGIAALRLLSLDELAITDNTESRYAAISFQMLQSGDWVTPRVPATGLMSHSPDWPVLQRYMQGDLVPFWGKPPLQFWLTCLSCRVFGVSAFAVRVPNFLIALLIVALTMLFAKSVWGKRVAVLAGIVLASSAFFLALAGHAVLDVPLTASVAGAMTCFARFAEGSGRRKLWGVGFFFALAVGALAKGPITLVLVGLSLGLWIVLTWRWRLLIELPWFSGLAVFLAVAAPWYVMAESATPGFLRYFLINEHVLRYVRNEYGDLYGFGRKQFYGMSWLMLAGLFLPWTVLLVAGLWRMFRTVRSPLPPGEGQGEGESGSHAALTLTLSHRARGLLQADPWLAYALIWAMAPAVFFTLARQIVPTYVFPGFPGMALATAVALDRWMDCDTAVALSRMLKGHLAAIVAVALVGPVVAVCFGASIPMAGALLVAALVIAGFALWRIRHWDAEKLLCAVAMTMAAAFTGAMFLVGPMINEQLSAKIILGVLYKDPAMKERPLVAPLGDATYSVQFYIKTFYKGNFKLCHARNSGAVEEALAVGRGDVFLFKRTDWDELDPKLQARFVPIVETPHWLANEAKR